MNLFVTISLRVGVCAEPRPMIPTHNIHHLQVDIVYTYVSGIVYHNLFCGYSKADCSVEGPNISFLLRASTCGRTFRTDRTNDCKINLHEQIYNWIVDLTKVAYRHK